MDHRKSKRVPEKHLFLLYWLSLCSMFVLSHVTSGGFPGGSGSKEPTCNVGDLGLIPGLGRSLEKGTATHSGILACWIQGVESMGLQRTQLSDFHFSYNYTGIGNGIYSIILDWKIPRTEETAGLQSTGFQ